MDKMESKLIKNKRERERGTKIEGDRELSIELNTGSEFIGRLEILTKIIDLNNCTYCTKPSKFKGISCAINAIQCYNFQKECYNYQNAVL